MELAKIDLPITFSKAPKGVFKHLRSLGIRNIESVVYNPSFDELIEKEGSSDAKGYEEVKQTNTGAGAVLTGQFTGRSPADKYIVRDELTDSTIWWRNSSNKNDNKPIDTQVWDSLYGLVTEHLSHKPLYVIDAYCGANKSSRLKVRFIVEVAWQAHFVKNMFIRPRDEDLDQFQPDFIVINASKTTNSRWREQGLNSENFIAFDLSKRIQIIGGTWYGGEMKKGLFSVMNYFLPLRGMASMHAAANMGKQGDVALFFGLSGTGKTTLSTDPNRALIGDDEHGWDENGVFNFEGGCYAKTINLDKENEPDIFNAIKKRALLENVSVDADGNVDYDDVSITQNTRVSYPLFHIKNRVVPHSRGGHAQKIIFLTADAYGVLPPVAKLSENQMQYHYLSGFTSKIAGTERGITKPQPTFSSCFGQAFLTLHPTQYAEALNTRVRASGASAYLVNTGWNGTGKRIDLPTTRKIISAILNGQVDQAEFTKLPIFNFAVPVSLPGVSEAVLNPRSSFEDDNIWKDRATELALKFIENFKKFADSKTGLALTEAGPQL